MSEHLTLFAEWADPAVFRLIVTTAGMEYLFGQFFFYLFWGCADLLIQAI
jgi:hypothetical protein